MATVQCSIPLQDFTCAVCKEVYTSPRFLRECLHCFCLDCITGLARAEGSETFPCPICRTKVVLPEGGAEKLPINFHMREEVLAEARKLSNKMCSEHVLNEIDRVCLTCEKAACKECMEHEGEGHEVRVFHHLEAKLEDHLQRLQEQQTAKKREQLNLQAKTSSHSRQIRHQRDLLHSMVEGQSKMNKDDMWNKYRTTKEKLMEEIAAIEEEVKKKKKQLTQTKKCWESRLRVSELVTEVQKAELQLHEVLDPSLVSTSSVPQPGLICSARNIDHTLSGFLGGPVEQVPSTEAPPPPVHVEDIKVPVQIRRPHEVHEILGVTPSDDGLQVMICFRGSIPHLRSSVAVLQAKDGAVISAAYDTLQGKGVCVFDKFRSDHYPFLLSISHNFGVIQVSKSHIPRMCLFRDNLGNVRLHQLALDLDKEEKTLSWQIPVSQPEADAMIMYVNIVDPFNMDVSPDGKFCVVIDGPEEGSSETLSRSHKKRKLEDDMVKTEYVGGEKKSSTERNRLHIRQPLLGAEVKLFHKGEEKPFDVYRPAKSTFVPSDVCFWKKRELLIADWQNDEIHVVHVGSKGFSFKHLLAERHGELVKPTALNTDSEGGVWIGCSNGSLLRYPMTGNTAN